MFANTASVVGCKWKSLKDGMKNPFGQCAPCGRAITPSRPNADREYQEQAVGYGSNADSADIRYERACRKRVFYRGLLRAL